MRVLCPPHAQTFKVFWMHNWTVNLFSLFNMSGMDSEIESLITFYSSVLVSGARNFATGVKNRRQKPTPVFWRRFQAPVSGARVFGITLSSLAQSLHNHPSSSSISALPYLCSTSSQHLLFISRHSRAAINIILVTDNWSFFSIYFVSGINSLLFLRQPHSSLSICLFLLLPYLDHSTLNIHIWLTPNETISVASGPKFTILCGHVEEILLLNKFFSDCRYMP